MLGRGLAVDGALLADLSVRTGRWPVLCGLVNGTLRRRVARGDAVAAAIRWAGSMLDHGGPTALDTTDSSARDKAIAAMISASLTMLAETNPGAVERYHELGVFPTDTDIPLADYLQHDTRPHAKARHRALLDSHRVDLSAADDLPTAWWRLPGGEPYLWRNLALHLRDAAWTDELARLTHDLRWASVKLHRLGPASAEADAVMLPGDPQAQALAQLLRGTSHLHQPGDSVHASR